MTNYFETLNNVNVNEHIEKKNGLSYLSWAWAWAEVKKIHPDANYTIYENKDGWNYFTDGRTGWVKTGVKIGAIEHIEYLPIMDFKNKSITLDKITSFDVNKAIQRSLTKACARHGLGLYIYAGEDLPEEEKPSESTPVQSEKAPAQQVEKTRGQKAAETRKANILAKEITIDAYHKATELLSGVNDVSELDTNTALGIQSTLESLAHWGFMEEHKALTAELQSKDSIPF